MKYILWYTAQPGFRDDLQEWLINGFTAAAFGRALGVDSIRVNAAVAEPDGLELYGSNETNTGDSSDAIVEVTCRSERVARRLLVLNQGVAKPLIRSCHLYEVEEDEVVNRMDGKTTLPSEGFKLMRGLFFFPDLPDSAVRRSWKHHQKLAVSVHKGLARYACIWVHRALTPGAPRIQGISVLHFPSAEELRVNYFDSARGRSEIIHDIAHFISHGTARVFAKEFIYLRNDAQPHTEAWTLWPMP